MVSRGKLKDIPNFDRRQLQICGPFRVSADRPNANRGGTNACWEKSREIRTVCAAAIEALGAGLRAQRNGPPIDVKVALGLLQQGCCRWVGVAEWLQVVDQEEMIFLSSAKQCETHGPSAVDLVSVTEWAGPSGGFRSVSTLSGDGARQQMIHIGDGFVW